MVSMGSMIMPATRRGAMRKRNGLRSRTFMASNCSVTAMVPSSAVMAAPTRPATTRAVSTGPTSSMTDLPTAVPTYRNGT